MIARYCYKHRSIWGVFAFLISVSISVPMLIAAYLVHWFWFLPAIVAVAATICTALAFVRNSEQGCSVDEHYVRWWRTNWPKIDKSIAVEDILKVHLHTWGESNQIRFMMVDRTIVKLNEQFVGSGKEIFGAIVTLRPDIEAQIDGKYKW